MNLVANNPAIAARRLGKRALAHCPHCHAPAKIRTSEAVDIFHRDIWFLCSNTDCGHSWKAQLAFVHSIALPARPRPGLQLPLSPQRHPAERGPDPPAPAND